MASKGKDEWKGSIGLRHTQFGHSRNPFKQEAFDNHYHNEGENEYHYFECTLQKTE